MWYELVPNPTILNNPTYFPPRYFAALFSYMERFRLLIHRGRLFIELDDPSAADLAKVLLKADVYEVLPPAIDKEYRLEATLSKPCALPISYLTRTYIDRAAPSSPNEMHLPVPADALISATVRKGTAVEIIAEQSSKVQEEINAYILKVQRRKKVKEGLPLPEAIDHVGDMIFDGGIAKREVKYVEPAKDKKLEAATEKATSKAYLCNVFIYGDSEESVKETLASAISSPFNSLVQFSLKRLRKRLPQGGAGEVEHNAALAENDNYSDGAYSGDAEVDAGAAAGKPAYGSASPSGGAAAFAPGTGTEGIEGGGGGGGKEKEEGEREEEGKEERDEKKEEEEKGGKGDEGKAAVGGDGEGESVAFTGASEEFVLEEVTSPEAPAQPAKKWKLAEKPSNHTLSKNRGALFKVALAAALLGSVLVHLRMLSLKGLTLPSLLKDPSPVFSDPCGFFLPEIVALGIVLALTLAMLVTKEYRTVGLSEFEIASLYSFPSPALAGAGADEEGRSGGKGAGAGMEARSDVETGPRSRSGWGVIGGKGGTGEGAAVGEEGELKLSCETPGVCRNKADEDAV